MEVVCVNAKHIPGNAGDGDTDLIEGGIYQVERQFITALGNPATMLIGIRSAAYTGAYASSRFRPLRDNESSARQQWADMLAGKAVERV